MTNLPPMPVRAFRDYFMIEDRTGAGGNLNRPRSMPKPALCGSYANVHERTPECTGAADCTRGVGVGPRFVEEAAHQEHFDEDPYERCDFEEDGDDE